MLIAAFLPALVVPVHAQGPAPDDKRQRELVHMVRQDCGSCHGLTLQGGLGPALTPAALRGKPSEGLVATIIGGRPGTPMPPFRGLIEESEAAWVVERLLEGFPADGGPQSAQRTAGTR
ncbi:cytochrome c [Azoarcus sp. PA01]|nr:cytochrome c [Azoarcus sp. PA01]